MDAKKTMSKTAQANAKRRWWARTVRLDTPAAQTFSAIAHERGVSVQVLFEQVVEKEIKNYEKNMAAT